LETRRNELDGGCAKVLSLFRGFDSEVKTSAELPNSEIERAERIAAEIDGDIRKYSEFEGESIRICNFRFSLNLSDLSDQAFSSDY
jgi:hypothetical protein